MENIVKEIVDEILELDSLIYEADSIRDWKQSRLLSAYKDGLVHVLEKLQEILSTEDYQDNFLDLLEEEILYDSINEDEYDIEMITMNVEEDAHLCPLCNKEPVILLNESDRMYRIFCSNPACENNKTNMFSYDVENLISRWDRVKKEKK